MTNVDQRIRFAMRIVTVVFVLRSVDVGAQDDSNEWSILHSSPYQSAHPDSALRLGAFRYLDDHDYSKAFEYFTSAAEFADKPLQAKLAVMS